MTIEKQPGFDPRLAWASEGGTLLAGACPVLVVVDILRFTTAVEVAVANGALVIPERWVGRERHGLSSLSPVSLLGLPAGTRVTLASPNGPPSAWTWPTPGRWCWPGACVTRRRWRRSSTPLPTWPPSWPPASPAAS